MMNTDGKPIPFIGVVPVFETSQEPRGYTSKIHDIGPRTKRIYIPSGLLLHAGIEYGDFVTLSKYLDRIEIWNPRYIDEFFRFAAERKLFEFI